MRLHHLFALAVFVAAPIALSAQEGYEFEVYGSHLVPKGETELELHSNFVPSGVRKTSDAESRATHRAVRSSIELSTGLTRWLDGSIYLVAYGRSGEGVKYVGNRARLTAAIPASWNLPFDLGVSNEVGFARKGFAEHQWAYEITPIFGKTFRRTSFVFNPAFEVGLSGEGREWEFEPRAQLGFLLDDDEAVGLEYYSVLGPITEFDTRSRQRHQLFVTGRADLIKKIEGTLALGRGFTQNSDRWVVMTKLEFEF